MIGVLSSASDWSEGVICSEFLIGGERWQIQQLRSDRYESHVVQRVTFPCREAVQALGLNEKCGKVDDGET
jgi:hypothetical protein